MPSPNTTTTSTTVATSPPPQHHPCPRCHSTNTKFCYYNNYNFSQPRHFCKSCRRYWTHGGTLRDVPIGGATRKNAKRSRRPQSHLANSNLHLTPPQELQLQNGGMNFTNFANFTSLLNGNYGGFGGFEDGFGRGYYGVGDGGCFATGGGGGNGWEVENGGCFGLSDVGISTMGMI